MSTYIKIALRELPDYAYPVLHFCYYLQAHYREWTGYKELEEWGINPSELILFGILSNPTRTGSYKFYFYNVDNVVDCYGEGETSYYYLDVKCLEMEEDVERVLKERNETWLTKAEDFEWYDQDLYNCLTTPRKQWINRKKNWASNVYFKPLNDILIDQLERQIKKAYQNKTLDSQPKYLLDWFYGKKWSGNPWFEKLYNDICDHKDNL